MPALPIIANAIRVTFSWVYASQRAAITFGVSSSTTDLSTVATIIDTAVTGAMWGHTTTAAQITQMALLRYDGVTPTYIRAVTGAKWAGSAAAGEVGVSPSPLVSLRTATRGQWARGRIYLPFPAESTIGNGSLVPGTQASMQTAWDAFRTSLASGGAPLQVISLVSSNGPPARIPAARPVISTSVELLLATQRRRQTRLRR